MSKLYFVGSSDSRKGNFTSRGFKWLTGAFLFNFTGGASAAGGLKVDVDHLGHAVAFRIRATDASGNSVGKIGEAIFNMDGSFEFKKG